MAFTKKSVIRQRNFTNITRLKCIRGTQVLDTIPLLSDYTIMIFRMSFVLVSRLSFYLIDNVQFFSTGFIVGKLAVTFNVDVTHFVKRKCK